MYGNVKEKSGQKWRIKWDIDGETTEFETDNLYKEDDLPRQGKQLLLFPLFANLIKHLFENFPIFPLYSSISKDG